MDSNWENILRLFSNLVEWMFLGYHVLDLLSNTVVSIVNDQNHMCQERNI